VSIDAIGPLHGDSDYAYLVVFICNMSRFITLKADHFLPILEQYALQFMPESLFYDNHGQFNNSDVDRLAKAFRIPIGNPAAYSHEITVGLSLQITSSEAIFASGSHLILRWAPGAVIFIIWDESCVTAAFRICRIHHDIVFGRAFTRRARLNISAVEYVLKRTFGAYWCAPRPLQSFR